jgi:hypothetical protein
MGCFVVLLAVMLPRVTLVMIFLFTSWLGTVFSSCVWPVLGFLFVPYTTLAYIAAVLNSGGHITPGWIILIIFAFLVDVGHTGGGYQWHRRRARVV